MNHLPELLFYAHSGSAGDTRDWQLLSDHLTKTADRAAQAAESFCLSRSAHLLGRLHDFGKYDPAFQKRLHGDATAVDHSTAGAHFLLSRAGSKMKPFAEMLAQAILGHHAGLPDTTGSASALHSRIENFSDRNPISQTIANETTFDVAPVAAELVRKIRPAQRDFDLSVAGRMVFSCLVDADFRDTEACYDALAKGSHDRDWPGLQERLAELRGRFDQHMSGLGADSALDRLRAEIMAHIRSGAAMPPGLFTLTVPTGGGKTLASMGFALDHAERHDLRRIIYAIPYTSIIDQTAAIFRDLFGDLVLGPHASVDSEKPGPEGRDKLRLAAEDWAAPIVVTTNVQFFESLFAARPARCRKLHNIAGSVIILDEAQCLPRNLRLPALRMLDTLAAHYGCTIVLCTATQPAFDSALLKDGLPLAGRELAPDPEGLARRLRRAEIVDGGDMEDAALIAALRDTPQAMVIVNSRRHALELYQTAQAEGLEGLVHLSTQQYPAHRRAILADLKARLADGCPCRLISTSLIEAGVNLDFPKGWRAEAGLDSVVQAAGRVNREGRRPLQDSTLTVFRAPMHPPHRQIKPLADAMQATARRLGHESLLDTPAIRDWFERVYWQVGPERLGQPMVTAFNRVLR